MKKIKINLGDKVLIKDVILQITRINRTTFEAMNLNGNLEVYFIKQIDSKISTQTKFEFDFKDSSNFKQLVLF